MAPTAVGLSLRRESLPPFEGSIEGSVGVPTANRRKTRHQIRKESLPERLSAPDYATSCAPVRGLKGTATSFSCREWTRSQGGLLWGAVGRLSAIQIGSADRLPESLHLGAHSLRGFAGVILLNQSARSFLGMAVGIHNRRSNCCAAQHRRPSWFLVGSVVPFLGSVPAERRAGPAGRYPPCGV